MSKELDEQVAIEVMGWADDPLFRGWGEARWSPSTNIKNAWEVVEKIKSDCFRVQYIECNPNFSTGWFASDENDEYRDTPDIYKTPTEAICRYALELVRSKK